MRKYIFIVLIILIASQVFSQQRQPAAGKEDQVNFLDTVGKKNIATVGDAEVLFKMVMDTGLPVADVQKNDEPVKKGYIAFAVADNLKLTDSLLFTLFKSRRYAFRVCVAHKLLNPDGSENDMMSGEELIEFLRLAVEYKEQGAAK